MSVGRGSRRRLDEGMRVLQTSCAILVISGLASIALAEAPPVNLLQNASFEDPKIEGRVDNRDGGAPARLQEGTSWSFYQTTDPTGTISVGLTNELARTGKQSIYVDFKKAAKVAEAFLMTEVLPIKGAETYRISIWGRLDHKRPLTLVASRPLLRVEAEFYQADLETQTGDTAYRTQQIPGSPRRILFQAEKWNEYFTEVKSPEDAAFMKVTFRWQTTGEGGEANGLIFFDDAVVDGPVGTPAPKEEPDAPAPTKPVAVPPEK